MNSHSKNKDTLQIVAYGFERLGYVIPASGTIEARPDIHIHFEPFKTSNSLSDSDGVIVAKGIWAKWTKTNNPYATNHNYLTDVQGEQCQKRRKEVVELVKRGGFVCFLMDGLQYGGSDLAEEIINDIQGFHCERIDPTPHGKSKCNEMATYFQSGYSVAKNRYSYYGSLDFSWLASTDSSCVSACVGGHWYFVPLHDPDKALVANLLTSGVLGIVDFHKRNLQQPPKWIDDFVLVGEDDIKSKIKNLQEEISKTQEELRNHVQYKGMLYLTDHKLSKLVSKTFKDFFKFQVEDEDKNIDDFQLLDETKKTIAVCEVKSTSGNVKREDVNQVDSHRSRLQLPESMPGILIVNQAVKKADGLVSKESVVPPDQIAHASKMNVLILRTIDLLRLISLALKNPSLLREIKELFLSRQGWLEVDNELSMRLHKNKDCCDPVTIEATN